MELSAQIDKCLSTSETLSKRSRESTFLSALTQKLHNKTTRGSSILKELQINSQTASKRLPISLSNYLIVVEDGLKTLQAMEEAFKFDQLLYGDKYKTSLYGLLNNVEQAIHELDSELQVAKAPSSKKIGQAATSVANMNTSIFKPKTVPEIFHYIDNFSDEPENVDTDILFSLLSHFYVPQHQLKPDFSEPRWVPRIMISKHWRVGTPIYPVEEKAYISDHPESFRSMLREIRSLSKLQVSPYFVRFCGLTQSSTLPSLTPISISLLVETTESGTLSNHLKTKIITSSKQMVIIEDLLNGMAYLHTQNLLHCNINTDSILITSSGRAKITGLEWVTNSRRASPKRSVLNRLLPTRASDISLPDSILPLIQWFDVDLVLDSNRSHSIATDVYSVGLVIWSMFSHQIPYENLSLSELLSKYRRGVLPEIGLVPEAYQDLLRLCWHPDPTARLTIRALISDFRKAASL